MTLINSLRIKKYNQAMIEEYIPGQEIRLLLSFEDPGAIELIPKRKFYGYS